MTDIEGFVARVTQPIEASVAGMRDSPFHGDTNGGLGRGGMNKKQASQPNVCEVLTFWAGATLTTYDEWQMPDDEVSGAASLPRM